MGLVILMMQSATVLMTLSGLTLQHFTFMLVRLHTARTQTIFIDVKTHHGDMGLIVWGIFKLLFGLLMFQCMVKLEGCHMCSIYGPRCKTFRINTTTHYL